MRINYTVEFNTGSDEQATQIIAHFPLESEKNKRSLKARGIHVRRLQAIVVGPDKGMVEGWRNATHPLIRESLPSRESAEDCRANKWIKSHVHVAKPRLRAGWELAGRNGWLSALKSDGRAELWMAGRNAGTQSAKGALSHAKGLLKLPLEAWASGDWQRSDESNLSSPRIMFSVTRKPLAAHWAMS